MADNPFLQAVNNVDKGRSSTPPAQTGGGSNPFLQAVNNVQPIAPPVGQPQTKPSPIPPQPNILQNVSQGIGNIFEGIGNVVSPAVKGFFTPVNQTTKIPIKLPENLQAKPTPQLNINPVKTVPSAQPVPSYYESPQFKAQSNLIDHVYKDPVGTFYEGVYNFLGGDNKNSLNNKIYQAENKFIVSQPILNNRFTQDVLRSAVSSTLNFSSAVEDALKQQLPRSEAKNFTETAIDTVGEGIGQVIALVGAGKVLKAVGLTKLILPVTFATIGQLSTSSREDIKTRVERLPVDLISGWLFSKIPGSEKFLSKRTAIGAGTAGAALSATGFIQALMQGLSPEDAAKLVPSLFLTGALFHTAATGLNIGIKKSLQSSIREGTVEFTPQEVRDVVIGSNLENTKLGNDLLKVSIQAETEGKNIQLTGVAAQKSPVAKALKRETPEGVAIDWKLVEPTVTKPEEIQGPVKPENAPKETKPLQPLTSKGLEGREGIKVAEEARGITNVSEISFNLRKAGLNINPYDVNTPLDEIIKKNKSWIIQNEFDFPYSQDSARVRDKVQAEIVRLEEYVKQGIKTPKDIPLSSPLEGAKVAEEARGIVESKTPKEINIKLDKIFGTEEQLQAIDSKLLQDYESLGSYAQIKQAKENFLKYTGVSESDYLKLDLANRYRADLERAAMDRDLTDFQALLEEVRHQQTGQKIETGATVKPNGTNEIGKNIQEVKKTEVSKPTQATEGQSTKDQGDKTKVKTSQEEGLVIKPEEIKTLDITKQDILDVIVNKKPLSKFKDYSGGGLTIKLSPQEYYSIPENLRFQNINKFPVGQNYGDNFPSELRKKLQDLGTQTQEQAKNGNFVLKQTKGGFDVVMDNGVVASFKYIGSKEKVTEPLIGKMQLKELLKNSDEFKANPVLTVIKDNDGKLMLAFDGKNIHFKINIDAMQLRPENLKVGDKIKINEESFKTPGSQMRVYKGSQVYADMGGYADLDNYPAAPQEEQEKWREEVRYFTGDLVNVEFPELLKLAKELMNNVPFLKKFPQALGMTYGKGEGKIALNPNIFKDPKLAVRVFAHELGHLIDYLPEQSFKHGNILGRIANLRSYFSSFLKEYPDAPEEIITEKDRAKLRKEAKAQAEKGIGVNQKVTPDDILNVWRGLENKDPELEKYIAKLTDEDKVEIAKAAMKGEVHQFVHYQKAGIDVKRVYEDLLREEIIKRRLFEKNQIMKELKELSMMWKPFDENANAGFTKYRYSSVELYADAISVMMVRPDLLESKAPQFYKAFFNYLDSKPLAKSGFFDLQDLLNKGEEAVLSDREKSIREMFNRGEDLFKAKIEEQKKKEKDYLFRLKYELIDKNQKVIDKVRQAKKEGKAVSDDDNPVYWLESHNYVGGVQSNWVEMRINPIYKGLTKANVTWEDFGEVLFLERVINERGELANPLGFDPQTAQKQLDHLKKTMGEEKYQAIEEALPKYREAIKEVLEDPGADDFYTPELLAQIRENPAYATYQVLDYFETFIPASIKRQVGTLSEISNPATATIVKTLSMIRAIERNTTKNKIVNFLKTNFSDEVTPAKTVFNGKTHVPIEPRDRDIALFTVMEKGKYTGYYVDPYVAATMDYSSIGQTNAVIETLSFFNSKGFRPLFITFNLGFQTFNAVRDLTRLYKNLPTYNILAILKEYAKSAPASFRRAFHLPDQTIQEMEKSKILSITYNDIIKGLSDEDKQIDAVLARYGLSPIRPNKGLLGKALLPFQTILELISRTGDLIETMPKVTAYRLLDGKLPSEQMASFIRTSAGSPDFLRRGNGYKWYNNVFLFSNAIKEGIRADMTIAVSPKTRSGYWFKSALVSFLPKLLMLAATLGVFGVAVKKMFDNVSEYDKTNYTVVPLTIDKSGQTVYVRIPMDEMGRTLGGIFWKALNITKNEQDLVKNVTDIVSITGGQIPSVTPILTALFAAAQYVSGNNPYDFFRDRNVLSDTQFKAGPKYSFQPFAVWELNTLGASVFFKAYINEKGPSKQWYQSIIDAPIASNIFGRWLRVSDFGQKEQNQEIQRQSEQEAAIRTLDNKEALQKIVDIWNTSDKSNQIKSTLIKQYIDSRVQLAPPEKKADVAGSAKSAVRTALVKGQVDANTDSLIYATSNDTKIKILKKVRSEMNDLEFKNYTQMLLREGVVSGQVVGRVTGR